MFFLLLITDSSRFGFEKKAPLCAGLLRAVHTRRTALCKRSRALLFYTGDVYKRQFMDSLSLANKVVHVADICTCVLHPASSTHRQLTDEQLVAAGITPGLIRLSVGLEHICLLYTSRCV